MSDINFMDKPSPQDVLHYGVKFRSGRYPYGSGDDPYQHSGDFRSRVESLRKGKFTFVDENGKKWTGDNAIAKSMGMTIKDFRLAYSIATNHQRATTVASVKDLQEKGLSNSEIGRKLGMSESTVRSLLNPHSEDKMNQARNTADFLRSQIEKKGILDVGKGVENELGISRNKLDEAIYILELEGYKGFGGGVGQINRPGQQTILQVIGPKDMQHKDLYDYKNINSVTDYISRDDGKSFDKGFLYPSSLNSKRIAVKYVEDGGADKDGVVEIRRGVKDLSLGNSNYAQVRILVDGKYYIKGMAIYSDDLPKGKDILINSNKSKELGVYGALKKVKPEHEKSGNPFGSLIKEHGGQSFYDDPNGKYTDPITGKKKSLSLINKRSEEGDWDKWANKLPTQFLAKQNMDLIKRQIKLTKDEASSEYEKICSLTNPTIKKKLLYEFADKCDGASADLKLASLPRQKYKVILPIPKMKDDEVYAPTFKNGEKIALIRYPHGGTFEIPILTVNNKFGAAKKVLGNAKDAIGINKTNADRLSGADFDGDTVTCIPCSGNGKNSSVRITSTKQLKGLIGFDPKMEYGSTSKVGADGKERYYRNGKEFKVMKNTQTEMGVVSNLITDMTIKGASTADLAKAVRHSMVVIDAEKHKLDYKQSYIDNDIASLKKKWQGHTDPFTGGKKTGGAATLFSQATAPMEVLKRKGSPQIDPGTGKKTYKTVVETYIDPKTGKEKIRTQSTKRMYEVSDARKLSSGTQKEEAYADYANYMKSLANNARKEMMKTPNIIHSKEATQQYRAECDSLMGKLNEAKKNKPRERMATLMAQAAMKERKKEYESVDLPDTEKKKDLKKISQQEMNRARSQVGAKQIKINITDREWEAIQKGAITETTLREILNHADMDVLREKAMPRQSNKLPTAKISRIKSYNNKGYTIAEIAQALGVSTSTVSEYL